jgi:hypothetical protein
MIAVRKQIVGIYVDRTSQQWIVMDPEGKLWTVSSGEDPWNQRQPFHPTEETALEPVPGHYKYMLGLPT